MWGVAGEWASSAMRAHEALMGMVAPFDSAGRAWVERESAIYRVDRVQTPCMIETGIRSDLLQGNVRWYQALQSLDIPSELVVYAAGHGWTLPSQVKDSYERNIAWFDYWLLDKPYPDASRQVDYDSWKRSRATRAALGEQSPAVPRYYVAGTIGTGLPGGDFFAIDTAERRLYGAGRVVLDIDRGVPIGVVGDSTAGGGFQLASDIGKGVVRNGTIFDLKTEQRWRTSMR
jgi:hypothetical protein